MEIDLRPKPYLVARAITASLLKTATLMGMMIPAFTLAHAYDDIQQGARKAVAYNRQILAEMNHAADQMCRALAATDDPKVAIQTFFDNMPDKQYVLDGAMTPIAAMRKALPAVFGLDNRSMRVPDLEERKERLQVILAAKDSTNPATLKPISECDAKNLATARSKLARGQIFADELMQDPAPVAPPAPAKAQKRGDLTYA